MRPTSVSIPGRSTSLDAGVRSIAFVRRPEDAPAPQPTQVVIVTDTAWTPGPGERPDLRPARTLLTAAIERRDVFEDALARLDRWAEEADIIDRLVVEGTTYWYRLREGSWHWLHERLLWRYALDALIGERRGFAWTVPEEETALRDVLQGLDPGAGAANTTFASSSLLSAAPTGSPAATGHPLVRALVRRLAHVVGRGPTSRELTDRVAGRQAVLDERLRRLVSLPHPTVLVLTNISLHQVVGSDRDRMARDPNLGGVVLRLRDAGLQPMLIGLGVDHQKDAGWAAVQDADDLLPQSLLRSRWSAPEDASRAAAALAVTSEALGSQPLPPLLVDRVDLGPALAGELRTVIERTLTADQHQTARIERLLAEVRPDALLMTHEGIRTPWLRAARSAGIPSFAVQHGVLYPTHPGYASRRHPEHLRPTATFVFGDHERRVLHSFGYGDDEVEVTGSPRLDLDIDGGDPTARASDRVAIRDELGVGHTDRLLVVSTLHVPFVRRSHLVHMLERILGATLPGIHVVFKQHPGERDEGPYRALLEGLARAGGYQAPRISVVRDLDLYRLLRAADAHLGLHSTVLTDAVVTGTRNLIAIVEGHADLLGYVPAGVATPVRGPDDLLAALEDPSPADPRARRAFINDHFRPGNAGRRIASVMAGRIVTRGG